MVLEGKETEAIHVSVLFHEQDKARYHQICLMAAVNPCPVCGHSYHESDEQREMSQDKTVSNVENHPYDEVKALLERGGGKYHDITIPLPVFYRVLEYCKTHHPIRIEWYQLIEDILNDASGQIYLARINEQIRVQESNIEREIRRHEEAPKLTYKQLWESAINAMRNDADRLRRTHGISKQHKEL